MKALSLLQPWATLVVLGVKRVETRSWSTPYRGPLLIHASKRKAGKDLAHEPPFKKYIPDFSLLPFGYIIGRVTLTQVIRISGDVFVHTPNKLTAKEKAFGDYSQGRYSWILEHPVAFKKPIPAKGGLSVWEFDENLVEE